MTSISSPLRNTLRRSLNAKPRYSSEFTYDDLSRKQLLVVPVDKASFFIPNVSMINSYPDPEDPVTVVSNIDAWKYSNNSTLARWSPVYKSIEPAIRYLLHNHEMSGVKYKVTLYVGHAGMLARIRQGGTILPRIIFGRLIEPSGISKSAAIVHPDAFQLEDPLDRIIVKKFIPCIAEYGAVTLVDTLIESFFVRPNCDELDSDKIWDLLQNDSSRVLQGVD